MLSLCSTGYLPPRSSPPPFLVDAHQGVTARAGASSSGASSRSFSLEPSRVRVVGLVVGGYLRAERESPSPPPSTVDRADRRRRWRAHGGCRFCFLWTRE